MSVTKNNFSLSGDTYLQVFLHLRQVVSLSDFVTYYNVYNSKYNLNTIMQYANCWGFEVLGFFLAPSHNISQ